MDVWQKEKVYDPLIRVLFFFSLSRLLISKKSLSLIDILLKPRHQADVQTCADIDQGRGAYDQSLT